MLKMMDILILYEYLPIVLLIWFPIIIYYWCLYDLNYWKRHKVLTVKGYPLIGNLFELITHRKSAFNHFYEIYHNKKCKNVPIVGYFMYHKKTLIIREPELIKKIFVQDYNYFSNRHSSSDVHTDLMGAANLFFLRNPYWRPMRQRLTPIFSAGRVRKMFYLIDEIGRKLDNYLEMMLNKKASVLNFKELAECYTTDVIASCAFGVYANSIGNSNSEFRKAGQSTYDFTLLRSIEFGSFFTLPEIVPLFKFQVFPKKLQQFLRNSINHIMGEREKTGETRNDLIDALVKLKQEDNDKVTDKNELAFQGDVLVAQAAIFFAGGFETSATLISFALYELAWNWDIQCRLRKEITDTLIENNNVLTNDIIKNMTYLDMVTSETLRLYPVLPFLDRLSVIPKNEDGYSLAPYHSFKIPNGMPILIPIYAIHRDPKYFPNPDTFDPERFSEENKSKIIPYTYMPFGHGPKRCIAECLGTIQSKVAIISVIKNYCIKPSVKSPKKVQFDERSFTISQLNGNYLNLYKCDDKN